MANEKFVMKVAVGLILRKDDKILLLRRFNTGWRDGEYSLIAGHVDGNETIAHAMAREAKEEGDITVTEEDLHIIHVLHRINASGTEYIDYFLEPEKWSGEPKVMEKDKCDDLGWFPIANFLRTWFRMRGSGSRRSPPASCFLSLMSVRDRIFLV